MAQKKIEKIKVFGDNCVHYGAVVSEDGKREELARHSLKEAPCKAREGDEVAGEVSESKEWAPSFEAVLRMVGTASVAPNNLPTLSNELWAAIVADRTALLTQKLRERKLL